MYISNVLKRCRIRNGHNAKMGIQGSTLIKEDRGAPRAILTILRASERRPSRPLMMECRWAGRLRCVETGSGNVRRRVVGTYAPFQRYRIYSSGHRGRPGPRRLPPRLPSRSSLLVRLTPGMRNSTISRGTPRGPRDTWTLKDEDNENGGSPDEASEVRRLPRPREEARIVCLSRARGHRTIISLRLSMLAAGLARQWDLAD